MVTADHDIPSRRPLLPFRRRPSTLVLPEDPSEEELVQYWTLSSQDKDGSLQVSWRGPTPSFCGATLYPPDLWPLPPQGRAPPLSPSRIISLGSWTSRWCSLARSPNVWPRRRTICQRIRPYLGWQPFDEAARAPLNAMAHPAGDR